MIQVRKGCRKNNIWGDYLDDLLLWSASEYRGRDGFTRRDAIRNGLNIGMSLYTGSR